MANVIMKNRVTTEYRKVEKDSDEFWALRAELHADGRPRWEQTGEHDLAAFEQRVEAGTVNDTDRGDAAVDQVIDTLGDPNTAAQLDRGYPTPGELEQNAGRAAEFSDEELEPLRSAAGVGGEGYPAGHPPQVTDEDGGELSDEEKNGVADNPLPDGGVGGGESTGSSSTDLSRLSVAQLRQRSDDAGLTVERSDGKEGDPVKADYVAALEGANASSDEDDDE